MSDHPLPEDGIWDREAIHTWFNLTYSNYLVLPRSVLQSMPDEWQKRFVLCLREAEEAFGHLDWPVYDVRALVRGCDMTYPSCEECEGEGKDEKGEECVCCGGSGSEEPRYETPENVGFRADPIPHYNRGRTRLEPRA